MMAEDTHSHNLSHTRGVPLTDLSGLCFILGERGKLSVKNLANEAIKLKVIEFEPLELGGRLPTRINHRMISLRELNLVTWESREGFNYYSLTPNGTKIYELMKESYQGYGEVELNSALKMNWREILAQSSYVRLFWLKYFMNSVDFNFNSLLKNSSPITITKSLRKEFDNFSTSDDKDDTGYRIISNFWEEKKINDLERREILQGLKRWTEQSYLTDDIVIPDEAAPFAYLSKNSKTEGFINETFVVKSWFTPEHDLAKFEDILNVIIDKRRQGDRINIPDLIIDLSYEHRYSKDNVKEMLTKLFYERRNNYFFERGSQFLIENAFKLTNRDKPAVYYLNLEGSWRTSLVRFGKTKKV